MRTPGDCVHSGFVRLPHYGRHLRSGPTILSRTGARGGHLCPTASSLWLDVLPNVTSSAFGYACTCRPRSGRLKILPFTVRTLAELNILCRLTSRSLVTGGKGKQFDAGHRRLMKEWVSIPAGRADWGSR